MKQTAQSFVVTGLALLIFVPAKPLDAAMIQSGDTGSIVGIKRLRSADDTKEPRKVKRETPYVQICSARKISEQPPITGTCQATESGDDLLWGESLRVEKLFRVRVLLPLSGLTEAFVFLPRLFSASGAATWPPGGVGRVERGEYELSRQADLSILDILSGSLIAVDHDAARLKQAGFRVRAAGVLVESEHTTWFLGVDGGEATLVADSGAVMITPDTLLADSLRATWGGSADRLMVNQGSTATWSRTTPPVVAPTPNPALWREAIRYNGDNIWDDGGFPWIIVPVVAVPTVLCLILCDSDGNGKTGTVTIPVP